MKIEKDSVEATLLIPLYGRKMCTDFFPEIYQDHFAEELIAKVDYDFSELEKKKETFQFKYGALLAGMRQLDMTYEIKEYLKKYPKATVVNLGCGLDETGKACDNGECKIVNFDFPSVIEARNKLLDKNEREQNIACDLNDFSWVDKIDGTNGVIFFAAGVFYYFKREEVKKLALELANRFPNGCLVFDSVGKKGLKIMLSKLKKNMKTSGVDSIMFSANKPLKELQWSDKIKVSAKGYMLGYNNMKYKSIKPLYRMVAKIGDRMMHMSINKFEFIK